MTKRQTVGLIAGREIRQRLRSKLFFWSTILLSGLFIVLSLVPTLIDAFSSPDDPTAAADPTRIAVVGDLDEARVDALHAALGPVDITSVPDEEAGAALLAEDEREIALVIVVGERVLAASSTGLFGGADEQLAATAAEALALVDLLEAADAGHIAGDVLSVDAFPVELIGDDDPAEAFARFLVANVGVVSLFGLLMFYASMIVNGIIEEKGSRVVELLVEAVPIRQLMAGKVLGLGAVAIGQALTVFLPALTLLMLTNRDLIPPGMGGLLVVAALWFVLGYAFYSLLCAGLGALVSRPEEAQAVLTPATMLALVGYLLGFAAIQAPDATWTVAAGWFPPTAPFVMLVRQAVGSPTVVQIAGSALLMLVAIVGAALAAARVYEGGILRVGARVRFGEAWRSRRI